MKLIGLDVGDRRIGVAFGDSTMRLAIPVDVIVRTTFEVDTRAIQRIVREHDAGRLIVGLPRNTDGSTGPQAEATRVYAERVAAALNLPLEFWDEHLTTVEATRRAQEAGSGASHSQGRRRRKFKSSLDAMAAAVILQDYMDAKANEKKEDVA